MDLVAAQDLCPWWIPFANLVGSVAFGVSAVAAFVVPATGPAAQTWSCPTWARSSGALCFLGGAVLLLPERTLAAQPGAGSASTRRPWPIGWR